MIGHQISHYRILDLIREGGMGVVYRAQDLNLPRQVAVKVLRVAHRDPQAASERFLREAVAVSRIDHPNVITLYEVFQQDGVHYMVMQLIEGGSLRDRMRTGRPELGEALRFASEIGAGLQAVHEIGIVHRDLKPDNVMLTRTESCKILDFGVAHLADRSTLTDRGGLVGTLPYMAPEQLRGGTPDARTDIYALGVLLFELLTGRLPFEADNDAALFYQISNRPPPSLASLRPDVPPELDRIVAHALATDPRDRYQHMSEMLADLEVLKRRIVSGRAAPREKLFADLQRPRGRVPWLGVGAGVILLGLAIAYALRPPAGPPTVLVMRWENETGVPANEWLCSGIMDCLIRALSGRRNLGVVSRQTVLSALASGRRTLAGFAPSSSIGLADRLGARYLATGNIERDAGKLRVNCDLIDVRSGKLLHNWSSDLQDSQSQFYPMVDGFASAIAGAVGRRTPSKPGRPASVAAELTQSLDALKLYDEAVERKELDDEATALIKLRQAVGLDSTFVEAHLLLAELSGEPAERRAHLAAAMKFRPKASELTRRLVEAEQLVEGGRRDSAITLYRAILVDHPNDVVARYSLGELYDRRRRFSDAAAEFAVLHQLNPFDYSFYPIWSGEYLELGRKDRAVGILEDWHGSFPDEPGPLLALSNCHFVLGNYQLGLALCDTLAGVQPGSDRRPRFFHLVYLGRLHAADSVVRDLEQHRDPTLAPSRPRSYRAFLEYRRRRFADGLRLMAEPLGEQPDTYNEWLAGILAAGAGDTLAAEERMDSIRRHASEGGADTTEAEARGDRRFLYHLRGEIALAEGRPAQAVDWYRTALRFSSRRDDAYFRTDLGHALLKAGRPREAVPELQRVLEFNPNCPQALLDLGGAYLSTGDKAEARRALERLRTLWGRGDPDDPLNIQLAAQLQNASSTGH